MNLWKSFVWALLAIAAGTIIHAIVKRTPAMTCQFIIESLQFIGLFIVIPFLLAILAGRFIKIGMGDEEK